MAKKTVLIVEDDELNLKLIRTLVKLQDCAVLEAGDAESGLELARVSQPDLILMDIQLPGMNGLSATKLIKQDSALKHIPVLAVTAYVMLADEQTALEAGCAGYISKPIDTRRFSKTVSRFLNHDTSSQAYGK
jgi:CheY-like chemotaxis protein